MMGRLRRGAWLTVGVAALGAGVAGAVLPLVPATPFLLVAAFAFARSSPRLHRWLLNDSRFGPVIRDWQRNRSISRSAKRNSIVAIIATLLLSWGIGVAGFVLAVQAIALSVVAAFILSRPDGDAT